MSKETHTTNFTASDTDAGTRLDAFLAERIEDWSRSRLQRLIADGDVLVNQTPAKASYKLRENDEIDVDLTEVPAARFEPEDIPLNIVFEDEYLAVINKPAGMVVHPGSGIQSGTLANAIAFHFLSEPPAAAGGLTLPANKISFLDTDLQPPATAGGSDRVGIVHRLDKNTSGLIVVAKDEKTHEALSNLFRDRKVRKVYTALVHGSPRENTGVIDRPMARDRWHRTKMTVAANGRNALSLWKIKKRFDKFALVEVEIKTGRTHQIRVHLASINHPVVGDETYNEGRDNTVADPEIRKAVQKLGRFFLHAEKLSFVHPVTNAEMDFDQQMPKELKEFLDIIKG